MNTPMAEERAVSTLSTGRIAALVEQHVEEFVSLRQMMRDGKLSMVEIAPASFLCLVQGRTKASPLFIGDHLFIFIPQGVPDSNLARYLSKLILNLPKDCQQHIASALREEDFVSVDIPEEAPKARLNGVIQ